MGRTSGAADKPSELSLSNLPAQQHSMTFDCHCRLIPVSDGSSAGVGNDRSDDLGVHRAEASNEPNSPERTMAPTAPDGHTPFGSRVRDDSALVDALGSWLDEANHAEHLSLLS